MYAEREPLADKSQTASRIKSLVKRYYTDLDSAVVSGISLSGDSVPLSSLPLSDYFNFVRKIPYRRDVKPIEVIARPKHILTYRNLGMDCKKKAILMGSYFQSHGIPYRFIGSSQREDRKVHHIFPQIKQNGKWLNADATYSDYRLYEPKRLTYCEVL